MRANTIRVRVILVGILVLCAAWPLAAQNWSAVWRDPEVVNYELTMEKIRKLVDVQRALTALSASEPDVLAKMDADMKAMRNRPAPPTLADAAGLLDRHASVRSILAKNGLTAREWLAMSGAMSTAAVALVLDGRTSGAAPASPSSAAQQANVALLKNNRAEWQKIEQEFKQLAADSASRKPR